MTFFDGLAELYAIGHKPTLPLGHTSVRFVFQRPAFLNKNGPSYQHGLGSYKCP